MAKAGWLIFSGDYSFVEINVSIFVTDVVTWFSWVETFIVALLADLGRWILSIPILDITPIKSIAGVLIGWRAYSKLKNMQDEQA